MKENIKSVVVLTAICLVVAALLAVTNFYTAPIIEANKAAAATGSLAEVIPGAAGFEEVELPADAPATVKNLYKETSGLGYVMLLETSSNYSASPMAIQGLRRGLSRNLCGSGFRFGRSRHRRRRHLFFQSLQRRYHRCFQYSY